MGWRIPSSSVILVLNNASRTSAARHQAAPVVIHDGACGIRSDARQRFLVEVARLGHAFRMWEIRAHDQTIRRADLLDDSLDVILRVRHDIAVALEDLAGT